MSNIVHFEQLWELAEKISIHSFKDTVQAGSKLKDCIEIFNRIHKTHLENPGNGIAKQMKFDQVGQILFLITAISAHENIDVYSALKQAYEVTKFQKELNLGLDQLAPEVQSSSNGTIGGS